MILRTWGPALLLGVGSLLTVGVDPQHSMPLRLPLDEAVPAQLAGFAGTDLEISEAEQRVAGMSSYVMRLYSADAAQADLTLANFSVYVGYYDQQMQGKTIHSPKNCLPGSGWEALMSRPAELEVAGRTVHVNRFLLKREDQQALVLYWYQGRGRIEANEYTVKWNLLRDAAFRRRSDEALVRVLVPVTGSEDEAYELALEVARSVIPAVDRALPL